MHHRPINTRILVTVLFVLTMILTSCKGSTVPSTPHEPEAKPALTLDQNSADNFVISDFGAVHAVDAADPNKFLIFGNLPVTDPAPDLPAELSVYLGRWEGYNFGPPIKKDRKLVLSITDITQQGGTVYGYLGYNLQFPDVVEELQFEVVRAKVPALKWHFTLADGSKYQASFVFDKANDQLVGEVSDKAGNNYDGPFILTRNKSFYVYQDYPLYLKSVGITTHTWKDSTIQKYGKGYMLYLPEGYETDATKTWPLLFFLHGYGDRGTNLLVLAKASPFMYIREKGPLPFIIVAPLLDSEGDTNTFPNEYMDGALAEIKANYRVDEKRMYLTGLSMGGEGTWKFALHQPDLFAAIAPLCGYYNGSNQDTLKPIKDLPVWAIHGADDTVVPLYNGRQPVDALKQAGGNVKFTILAGHDHDVWTDTYSDRAIYDWLLQYQKP